MEAKPPSWTSEIFWFQRIFRPQLVLTPPPGQIPEYAPAVFSFKTVRLSRMILCYLSMKFLLAKAVMKHDLIDYYAEYSFTTPRQSIRIELGTFLLILNAWSQYLMWELLCWGSILDLSIISIELQAWSRDSQHKSSYLRSFMIIHFRYYLG